MMEIKTYKLKKGRVEDIDIGVETLRRYFLKEENIEDDNSA